eukprot:1732653-Pyramimonas_sp.AAC.1
MLVDANVSEPETEQHVSPIGLAVRNSRTTKRLRPWSSKLCFPKCSKQQQQPSSSALRSV